MFKLFFIVLSILYSSAFCEQRMVGGNEADISTFNWQVSLSGNFRHFCGAAIISKRWAVTSAFCAKSYFISASRIRAGSNKHNASGTLYEVEYYISHHLYDKLGQNYNVGLVLVTKDFKESRRSRPARLVDVNIDLPAASLVTASGWGSETIPGTPVSANLRAISLHVVDNKECLEKNQKYIDVTDKMFCAGSIEDKGKSICKGDFGGPVVDQNGVLVGVSAFSVINCTSTPYPNVFTRLADPEIRGFIKKHTGI